MLRDYNNFSVQNTLAKTQPKSMDVEEDIVVDAKRVLIQELNSRNC